MTSKVQMRNYFKVLRTEAIASSRAREDDFGSPRWADSIRARVERITSHPPRPIEWSRFFFFEEDSHVDTMRAWLAAMSEANGVVARVHVARLTPIAGPWSKAQELGELHPPPEMMA